MAPSSSGSGRQVFNLERRVRFPLGLPFPARRRAQDGTQCNELGGYDLRIGQEYFWRIPTRCKFANIPKDAKPAFLGPDGAPYRAWREIAAGNWRPSVAFLEGIFWSVRWTGYDAEREKIDPGGWLVEGPNFTIRAITEAEFERLYGDPATFMLA